VVVVEFRVCHTKLGRFARPTGHNFPSIFTELVIIIVSQEMWPPIVFGGSLEYFCPSNLKSN